MSQRSLPAGLLPTDTRIEFFVDQSNPEISYYMTEGKTTRVRHGSDSIKSMIRRDISKNPIKAEALVELGYVTDDDQLEKYCSCCFGAFDGNPDVINGVFIHNEYWPCPKRGGQCPVEGRLCDALVVSRDGKYLTVTEIKSLVLVAKGKLNKEIGSDLGISEETVKVHLKHIYTKSGSNNKMELVLLAYTKNLL